MFVLALVGLLLAFTVPFVWHRLRRDRGAVRWSLLAMVAWLPVALLPASNWDETQGRRSGLWNIAQQLPAPWDRSALLVPLSILGAGLLTWLLLSLPRKAAIVWTIAVLTFIAAQTANAMAWQKYYEPFLVLSVAAMLSVRVRADSAASISRRTAVDRDAR
jgi:hypothetical protein